MDKPKYLIVARVLKPWGVRGEIKCEILTEFPDRFASLQQVYLGDDAKPFSVEHTHLHSGSVLIKLKGIDTPEAAAKLREQLMHVAVAEAVALPPGKVFLYQMVGLSVRTIDGTPLGKITDVLDTGANDVYVVHDGTREILLPAIPDVIKEINFERGEILVELIDGLI